MSRLPHLLTTLDLPAAELASMRLDGEVYALGDGWCPIDVLEGPIHRALAARGTRSPRLIAELATAAWVWGALPAAPSTAEFCVDLAARARVRTSGLVRVRELALEEGDCVQLGAAAVTSPLRTAVELARCRNQLSAREENAVVELSRLGGFGLVDCLEFLTRRRKLPDKRRAILRLTELLTQPAFTR